MRSTKQFGRDGMRTLFRLSDHSRVWRRAPVVVAMVSASILVAGYLTFVSLNAGAADTPNDLGSPGTVGAITSLGTVDWSRTSSYQGSDNATPDLVYYYTDGGGNLAVVTYHPDAHTLTTDMYNPTTLQRVGATTSISTEGWPDWGGFYAGPDGHFYVLVGRGNPDENDSLDVVAVRRYDANWSLVGTAYLKGGASQGVKGIYSPFEVSAPHMVLVGQRLAVHMGRTIFGKHHQVNLTFEVDVNAMTATTFQDLGDYSYSSHSFQQFVAMNGSSLITIDHGDTYPRAIVMGVMDNYPTQRHLSQYKLFEFNGAAGDNFTGATVTGLVSGPSGVVVLGSSIQQPNAPNGPQGPPTERHNIYAISATPETGAHTTNWLTNLSPDGPDEALEPRVVAVDTDQYAVLFSIKSGSNYRTEYRLINSAGTVIAAATFPGMFFSAGSDPILLEGKVYWAGINPDPDAEHPPTAYLFGLDVSNPAAPVVLGN